METKRDDVAAVGSMLVAVDGAGWTSVDTATWRAWTGIRALWGAEWHGPVYALGGGEEPWRGPRTCGCATCQLHVDPVHRRS